MLYKDDFKTIIKGEKVDGDIILDFNEPVYVEGDLIAGGRIFSRSTLFVDGALAAGGNIECKGDIIASNVILTTNGYFKDVVLGKQTVNGYEDAMNYVGNISGNRIISFAGIKSFGDILGNEIRSFGFISSDMNIAALTKILSLGDIDAREVSSPEVICNSDVNCSDFVDIENLIKTKIKVKRR